MSTDEHWDQVLSTAARVQTILPSTVLVGGTASALYARHRTSHDDDHVLIDLRERFDEVLRDLESVAGWKTARVQRPVQILGSLDGIETGVRQLVREQPLETTEIQDQGVDIRVPTLAEILRIKAVLILRRNATRDYLDFVALADTLGFEQVGAAMGSFDALYPQESGESPLQQLQVQLASPKPYDLEAEELPEYRDLDPKWQDWNRVREACIRLSAVLFDQVCDLEIHSQAGRKPKT